MTTPRSAATQLASFSVADRFSRASFGLDSAPFGNTPEVADLVLTVASVAPSEAPLSAAARRFLDGILDGRIPSHPTGPTETGLRSHAPCRPIAALPPAVPTTPGRPLFHHVCITCRRPWREAEEIAGGRDVIARDGLCSDPECERLYFRWMTSRSFRPRGQGGH